MAATLSLLTSFLYAFFSYLIGSLAFQEKIYITKRTMAILLLFSLLCYIINFLIKSSFSNFLIFFALIPLYRVIFHKNQLINTFAAFLIYTIDLLLKLIISYIVSGSFSIINFESYNMDKFILHAISFLSSLVILYLMRKYINKAFYKILTNKHKAIILLLVLFIDVSFNNLYQGFNITTTDFIILAIAIICLIYSIDKSFQLDNVNEDYKEISSYSKLNEELNRNYRKQIHENKNQLLMLRAMIGEEKNDLSEYLDCLLGDYKEQVKNYWLSDLSYIPLPGVKNFLNNKLIKMKEIGASIEIFVSNELADICLNLDQRQYKDFATVLGVVIDNMIDCVKEQEEKLISIHFFLENNELHGEFVNNFVGKIELDQIFSSNYSTKGKNRGVGLSLVNKIITDNDYIDCRPKIIDNFFVQDITLKLDKLLNYQKS